MFKRVIGLGAAFVFAALLAVAPPVDALSITNTTTESLNYNGQASNGYNDVSTITPGGRYVVFMSKATDLIPGFTPPNVIGQNYPSEEVYLRDRQTNTTELISQSTDGVPADNNIYWVPLSVSNDGRFVLFTSASNLSGSPTTTEGVYLRDRASQTTTRVSPESLDAYAGQRAMSGDGNFILYTTVNPFVNGELANDRVVTFLYNRSTDTTTPMPVGAVNATISNDGLDASYLGPAASQTAGSTVAEFRYDIATGASTQFTDTLHDNATGSVMSPDHTHAAYYADSADGTSYNLYDTEIASGQTKIVSSNVAAVDNPGTANLIESLSFDGTGKTLSFVTRPQGQNTAAYVVNLTTNETVTVDNNLFYKILSLTLTADGSELIFTSYAPGTNIRQIFSAHFSENLAVPTGLTAESPTQTPYLTWNAVSGADYYIVYRNGTQLGTSTSTNFTDSTAIEGTSDYSVAAANNQGIVSGASSSLSVLVDKTAPAVSNPDISSRVVTSGSQPTISAGATDALSGVVGGEYFIDADPGTGNGTPMSYANGTVSTVMQVSGLRRGRHTLYMRAQDAAGNWSTVTSVTFAFI